MIDITPTLSDSSLAEAYKTRGIRALSHYFNVSDTTIKLRLRRLKANGVVVDLGRACKSKFDSKMVELHKAGASANNIAKQYGVDPTTVLRHLRKAGALVLRTHAEYQSKVSTEDLVRQYQGGLGCYRLSKLYNIGVSAAYQRLKRLGILDPTRRHCRESTGVYKRPGRRYFNTHTKHQAFKREGGICEWCHQLIGDGTNYRLGTYHHRRPQWSFGRDHSLGNCMVLHVSCHQDNFEVLHGFKPFVKGSFEYIRHRLGEIKRLKALSACSASISCPQGV